MTKIVAIVSQKGGVGKSTLARALSREATNSGLSVKVADLDTQQGTFVDWHRQRINNGFDRIGSVETYAKASEALKDSENFDILIVDGAARASKATLEIARFSDLTILPTCASRDDLVPAIKLANELVAGNVPVTNLAFALCRVTTEAETKDARDALEGAGYKVLAGALYEKAAYRQAQNDGLAVTETRYKSLNEKADALLTDLTTLLLTE